MSSPRVKVKVYGLLWLSKRAYLSIQVGGVLLVVAAVALTLAWPRSEPIQGEVLPPFVADMNGFGALPLPAAICSIARPDATERSCSRILLALPSRA